MMHRAWSSTVEVPYCFSRSYVKFQGHTAQKIVEFDPNWAFPDSNSSLNSPMAMKCCIKLETSKERCPIVFQGHPSNFKVTRDKTSPILTQIGRFRIIGRSQLSNPSDLPCFFFVFLPKWQKIAKIIRYFVGTSQVIIIQISGWQYFICLNINEKLHKARILNGPTIFIYEDMVITWIINRNCLTKEF